VLGRLNGLVHAGCDGDETASVVARSMEALQVRIGTRIGSLDRDASWWGKMVTVRVNEGSVLIDYWPTIKS
jgi:septum site-determining protein MinC